MLKKITSIRNLGKFEAHDQQPCGNWNGELAPLTLIYGANGSGKTTLVQVFRSLQLNDPDLLIGRCTRGTQGLPEVVLDFDHGCIRFEQGRWRRNFSAIEIFDALFTRQHVHSGFLVEHDQKKKLHTFVIGRENIEAGNELIQLDNQTREIDKSLKLLCGQIKQVIKGNLSVDEFVALPVITDISNRLEQQRKLLLTLQHTDEILHKPQLSRIRFPHPALADLEALLQAGIETFSADAEQKVNEHISRHLDHHGKQWLEAGLIYANGDLCPFCGNAASASGLISAYRKFFSKAYTEFKVQLCTRIELLEKDFSENTLLKVKNMLTENRALLEFWKAHISRPVAQVDAEALETCWTQFVAQLSRLLMAKKQAPLDAVTTDETFRASLNRLAEVLQCFEAYHSDVYEFNLLIQGTKVKTEQADLAEEMRQLEYLENVQNRYAHPVDEWCEEYILLNRKKAALDTIKEQKRQNHKRHVAALIRHFGTNINRYLQDFTDDFSIAELHTNYVGGKPNLNYNLCINNTATELGCKDTPASKATFGNTLSEGDKAALAFSFFLSRLSVHPYDLRHKLIIFDDPVTNLDARRLQATASRIRSLQEKTGAQVMVLTHNQSFASEFESSALMLAIEQSAQGSRIVSGIRN